MNVIVACEYSGRVRDAFRARGHDAWSIDLLPCERDDKHHLQGDVTRLTELGAFDSADLIIAHPPCTYLCNSGVRWLYNKDGTRNHERWGQMLSGARFFNQFLNHTCARVCVENPIPHKYARDAISYRYDQIIQPWMFGHGETKATCLWLDGLPPLVPTDIVEGRENRIHRMSPSKDRAKNRSLTYQGIANAMAEQWG